MTLRIQCPACQRQFTVDEELKSRTVECGSCEKQFVVDEDAIVSERDRYFPGDMKKSGLKRYGAGRSPADPIPEVEFATATYSGSATAADVIPPTPGRTVAWVTGTLILVGYLVILVFGSMGNGVFSDVEIEKRILLSGFVVMVGSALIFSGGFRRNKQVSLTGVALAVMVMAFTVILRPKGNPEGYQDTGTPMLSPLDRAGDTPTKMSGDEVRKAMAYDPVQRAIDSFGQESVWALWAPEMRKHFRYQIQRYLQRKTGAADRPAFYPRGEGGLLIVEGISIKMPELVELVEHFADVENVYENLRVLHIGVKGENLVEPSTELLGILNNRTHESFIVLNKKELEHIDIDRVKDAAQRLSTVEPSRFRSEIARRLVGLLDEDADTEFRSVICKAIMVWSVPEDGAEPAVIRLVEDLIGKGEEVPKSMIELLIERRTPGGIPLLKTLWKGKPLDWESEVISMGSQMETVILPHINDENPAAQRSALLILRRVGTEASLPVLRKALETTGENPDMKLLIERAMEGIENPASVSLPAPEPEVESLSESELAPAPEPEVDPLSEPEPTPAPTPSNN